MQPAPYAQPDQPGLSGRPTDWTSIAQAALGVMGLMLSLLAAALFGGLGLTLVFGETGMPQEASAIIGIAWVCLFLAALTIPSIILSLRRLLRGEEPNPRPAEKDSLRAASLALILWQLLLLIGSGISQNATLAWLALPPLQLLIIAIPTWWLVAFIRRGLPANRRQRTWGLINFSVFVTTPVLMMIEILAVVMLLVLFGLWVASRPDIAAEIQRLFEQILAGPTDPEAIFEAVLPFLSNPWVIFGTLGMAAVLVPLIEELVKPLAVWLLVGRSPSPTDGFVAGALCGATFGLVESLLYLTNPTGDSWLVLAVGRTGTVLLHTATTALVGWGMASAWSGGRRRYLRLLGTYLLAVLLHGLWNALAILTGFGAVLRGASGTSPLLNFLAAASPVGTVLLAAGLFGVLLWGNQRLRARSAGAVHLPREE